MKKNPFKENKNEIKYNLVNCALAGGLVLAGSLTSGNLTIEGVGFALIAALIVCLTKFKSYWDGQANEYSIKLFNFI
jgi:hypothetical protein